jgi:hypothetical protein
MDPKNADTSGLGAKPVDPNAPSASGPEAGGTVPRPLPTLHADYFTPGTTPAAADLTPGAHAVGTPQIQIPPTQPKPRLNPPNEASPLKDPETPQ